MKWAAAVAATDEEDRTCRENVPKKRIEMMISGHWDSPSCCPCQPSCDMLLVSNMFAVMPNR